MTPKGLRVLIVDDHEVVRWGFEVLLARQSWVERCLVADNHDDAVAIAKRMRPDVALVDLVLGGESGAELCESLRAASPRTQVLLISGVGWISPEAASAAGAQGFVSKDWSAEEVAGAVQMVGKGMTVFASREEGPQTPLSEREQEVLELMASGSTNREIAERLYLSPHTVKEYASTLYRKLGARNRAEAVRRAERLGLAGRLPR